MNDFPKSLLDSFICGLSPERGLRRLAAKRVLHEFRYDGAGATSKRASAPHNMSPNSFDVQRDRLQLMREAEDMERNFAPAKMLNRKVAMYSSPISYHAQTGDHVLNREVEEYLNDDAFQNCDATERYGFYKMLEFGIMGMNRGGDYGWAFTRPGLSEGMTEDDAIALPLKIQAVEPDRIGGIYQNVVSNDYVSGLIIGDHGQITDFRVFHRSMTTNVYDNPVDIPAAQFVHMTDPMRIDQYRGVSVLATAIQNLRDLYEMIDFVKGKAKIASALTVFTNSNGAMAGGGAMDPYNTNVFTGNQTGMQQDVMFGQINHLAGGTDIKFPSSNSPSNEEQALMKLLLKFVAMSYNLPYSFALDQTDLGGVSSRLESEMAKAEFERLQGVVAPHAHRIKNALLFDAIAKGIFPISTYQKITKGRWGYRPHPQPDLGKEASAAVNLNQNGLLNPMKHWVDGGEDPETVAEDMTRWALIKKAAAEKAGMDVVEIFGNGPSKPVSVTESTTESTTTGGGIWQEFVGEKDAHQNSEDAASVGNMQSTAMNGAQVTALNDLAAKAASGEIPQATAKAIAVAAFPLIPKNTINDIFDGLDGFTPTQQDAGKQFSARHEFRESDASIAKRIEEAKATISELIDRKTKFQSDLLNYQGTDASPSLINRARVAIDRINQEIHDEQNDLNDLLEREWRRSQKKPQKSEPTPQDAVAKAIKAKKRDDRHALVQALIKEGYPENQAYAISYDIIESGKFQDGKLPADIKAKYFP